ncbi:MAG: PrsW family intramembrane metalloprotease [Patescibacteria group bacterium]
MIYPIYLLFLAIAPGLIWLFYFLKKDVHPEPKRMILKIFFLGMLSALPAALIEAGFQQLEPGKIFFIKALGYDLAAFLSVLVGVALVEEVLKYLVVQGKILRSSELDEPMDLVLYMIVAALGFATLENIFIFFSPEIFPYTLQETFSLAVFRFISATFLHALCSGAIGFFLALSFCEIKRKKLLVPTGFTIAILLHGLYNFSIMNLEGIFRFGVPLVILISLAIFITLGIKKLRKLKSICKI